MYFQVLYLQAYIFYCWEQTILREDLFFKEVKASRSGSFTSDFKKELHVYP